MQCFELFHSKDAAAYVSVIDYLEAVFETLRSAASITLFYEAVYILHPDKPHMVLSVSAPALCKKSYDVQLRLVRPCRPDYSRDSLDDCSRAVLPPSDVHHDCVLILDTTCDDRL